MDSMTSKNTAVLARDDYLVELVAHASLRVRSGGKTIITDPWYVDPINCNTLYHWPPLAKPLAEIVAETDAIYITHVHPDHFDPRTLAHFPKTTPIYIGEYELKTFRDEIKSHGFTVIECPFQTLVKVEGTPFEIAILESDYDESAAFDSSCIIRSPECTVFNNNDCFLKDEKYQWVADNFDVDYGFLGYSPASYFPICFDYSPDELQALLTEHADRRYGDFLKVAKVLQPKISVPFAMGLRFMHRDMLWQNCSFNSMREASKRLVEIGLRPEILNPGDKIFADHSVVRYQQPYATDELEEAALRLHALQLNPELDRLWAEEAPARADIVEQFKRYIQALWQQNTERFPEVRNNVIAYTIDGENGATFHFDFSRDVADICGDGLPAKFDMHYTYLDRMLQWRLDGEIDWDELHFSNRVAIKQNVYAAKYYEMVRGEAGIKS